jgi:predicted protein tyrosine phosphatase
MMKTLDDLFPLLKYWRAYGIKSQFQYWREKRRKMIVIQERPVFHGQHKKIWVLDRNKAEKVRPREPYLIVSITDPEKGEATLPSPESRVACVRLCFHDVEAPLGNLQPYCPEHTEDLVRVLKLFVHQVDLIIVHCEMGISRSAGVAAAIAKWLGEDDTFFFETFIPNKRVYQTTLEALL